MLLNMYIFIKVLSETFYLRFAIIEETDINYNPMYDLEDFSECWNCGM